MGTGTEGRIITQPLDYGPDVDQVRAVYANQWRDLNNDTRMRHLSGVEEALSTLEIKDAQDHLSNTMDVNEANAVWVGLYVESTGAPTDITFVPMLSFGGESDTMYEYREGLWASMVFEDTDTATGLLRTYLLACGGAYFLRFRVTATGAGAVNYFTTRIVIQRFRGNFTAGHA
jgi:hypothetical protein